MAATPRLEQELKRKVDKELKTVTDPVERLRLKCLSRGANGIKGMGRLVLAVQIIYLTTESIAQNVEMLSA